MIYSTSLRSLGLQSLTSVLYGRVLIGRNQHLCFVNTIDWRRITNSRQNAVIIRENNVNCGKLLLSYLLY